MPAGTVVSSLLWFIAILALIPLALWLLKRTPAGGSSAQGLMRSVAVLSLAPHQRLVTVEIGRGDARRWLVLGVTGESITTLHEMAPQDDALAAPQSAAPFSLLLARLQHKNENGDAH
ncbi:MAG: flagellar biosynthetic protein FliO [Burkholderiaceae bacterium]|nr:flagellar biosynthetic protein FliO [Burkholderiaceae bacterium]